MKGKKKMMAEARNKMAEARGRARAYRIKWKLRRETTRAIEEEKMAKVYRRVQIWMDGEEETAYHLHIQVWKKSDSPCFPQHSASLKYIWSTFIYKIEESSLSLSLPPHYGCCFKMLHSLQLFNSNQ